MSSEKNFKTIEEQIDLLKNKGLNIDNEPLLKWYLKSYNYQNLINGYNDFFMINNDRKKDKYKNCATSSGIIDLFNFDRNISRKILSNIHNIERMISTSLAYVISEIMNSESIPTGKIFSFDKNDPIILKIFKVNSDKNSFEKTKNKIKASINMEDNLFNKYDRLEQIPIWTLVVNLSFGQLWHFMKSLKANIFFEIINNSNLKNLNCLSKKEILSIFKILKDIRNRICHNNVLYNIKFNKNNSEPILKLLNYKKEINKNSVSLLDLIKTTEKLLDSKINNDYLSCEFNKNFEEIKNIHAEIKEEIIKFWK